MSEPCLEDRHQVDSQSTEGVQPQVSTSVAKPVKNKIFNLPRPEGIFTGGVQRIYSVLYFILRTAALIVLA